MKHLLLNNRPYLEILSAFKKYVSDKGYRNTTQSMLPACVQEFLFRQEQKGQTNIKWIEPVHIQEHYQYLCKRPNFRRDGGLSSSMVNHHIYALRLFFAWLQQIEAIHINPLSGMEFPKAFPKKREALTQSAIEQLYTACENLRDKAILSLYYGCGLRRSEGEALNRSDINFDEQKLIVRSGKYDKRREVPLHEMVTEYLRNYWLYDRPQYINGHTSDSIKAFVLNNIGSRMRGGTANDRVRYLAQKAGITKEVTLHVLRHSIATHLKENGMHLEQIMELLGHGSLDVTQAYIEGYRPRYHKRHYRRNLKK